MKKFISALTACLLLTALAMPAAAKGKSSAKKAAGHAAASAKADPDAANRQIFENRYHDYRMASADGNATLVGGLLAEDYTNTDLAGNTRKSDDILKAISTGVPDDSRKEKTTVNTVKIDGDTAEVNQTYDLTTIRKANGGATINYHMVTTANDTWVKKDGDWLLQKSVAETGDVFINDKQVAHKVRADAPADDKAGDKAGDKAPATGEDGAAKP